MGVRINTVIIGEMKLGSIQPSPYFTYNSNKVITGFVQDSPNVIQSGTYWTVDEGTDEDIEVEYSVYAPPPPFALNDPYALGVANEVFNQYAYSGRADGEPPINKTLTSINLPYVESIGLAAFSLQTQVSNVNIPEVITIGDNAFEGCVGITSLTLPQITSIGESAFSGCTGLSSVTMDNTSVVLGDSAFYGCSNLEEVDMPDAITIGNSTFQGCSKLNEITTYFVTSVGDSAFSGCTDLVEIYLQNVTSIGSEAFMDCTKLRDIHVGNAIQSIGEAAFNTSGRNPVSMTIGKDMDWVNERYVEWGLPSGSSIICTNGTIVTGGE